MSNETWMLILRRRTGKEVVFDAFHPAQQDGLLRALATAEVVASGDGGEVVAVVRSDVAVSLVSCLAAMEMHKEEAH